MRWPRGRGSGQAVEWLQRGPVAGLRRHELGLVIPGEDPVADGAGALPVAELRLHLGRRGPAPRTAAEVLDDELPVRDVGRVNLLHGAVDRAVVARTALARVDVEGQDVDRTLHRHAR